MNVKECNDATKNDGAERLDEATMQGLREMGAFGLQVPEKYGQWDERYQLVVVSL